MNTLFSIITVLMLLTTGINIAIIISHKNKNKKPLPEPEPLDGLESELQALADNYDDVFQSIQRIKKYHNLCSPEQMKANVYHLQMLFNSHMAMDYYINQYVDNVNIQIWLRDNPTINPQYVTTKNSINPGIRNIEEIPQPPQTLPSDYFDNNPGTFQEFITSEYFIQSLNSLDTYNPSPDPILKNTWIPNPLTTTKTKKHNQ